MPSPGTEPGSPGRPGSFGEAKWGVPWLVKLMGVSMAMGDPQNLWFITWKIPSRMDDLGLVPTVGTPLMVKKYGYSML